MGSKSLRFYLFLIDKYAITWFIEIAFIRLIQSRFERALS
jgi:hypothetical protein